MEGPPRILKMQYLPLYSFMNKYNRTCSKDQLFLYIGFWFDLNAIQANASAFQFNISFGRNRGEYTCENDTCGQSLGEKIST